MLDLARVLALALAAPLLLPLVSADAQSAQAGLGQARCAPTRD
jgi:hypothetical protein